MHSDHHSNLLMVCTHVLDENKPIGDVDDDIKHDTLICQNCIEKMCLTSEPTEKDIPNEVHLSCKNCVLEKLKKSRP